ncbi:uncharacterized protein LOC113516416 isoform X2 [Galleria mellonella]|uniref:Uncharacterized protein LOC113516416 isoform X2 n=1 Tax=Galleria mellonella TaxID=7137 RepID=A0ABM3MSI5_GALME|nr:uncharacterized protein LOC113516416 isoform X2 [Galleria mellonella]
MRPKQLDVLLGNRMRDGPSGNNKSRDKNDASKSSQSSTNGDFVIDEKLLMATEIPLIKIDETQTWKKFARNNSIDLNKIDIDLSVNKSTSELRPMRKVGPVEEMMKYCRPVWVVVSRMSGITGMAGAGRRVQLPDLAALRRRRPPTAHVAPQPHSPPSSHSSQSPRSPHSPRSPFTPHLPKLVDLSESDSDTSFDDTVEYLPSEKQLSDLLKHLTSLGVAESAAAWRRQRPTPPRRTRRHPRLAHVHLNCSCDRCYTSKKHRFVREQHEVQRQLKALLDSLPKSALVETRKPTSETEQDPDYRVKSKKRKKKKQSETTTRTALKPPSHDDYQEWIRQKNIHQRFFQLPSIESQRNKAQKETSHSINARGINNQMQPTHSRSNSNITTVNLATNCPTNPLRDILKQRLNERLECKQSEISMMKPNVDRKTIIFDESFRQRMVKSLTDMATKITSQDKSNINDQATNNVASKSIDVDSTDQMVIGQCAETARLNVKKVIEHIVGGQYLGSIIDDGNVVIPSGGKQINRLDVRRVIEQIIGGQSLGRIIDLDNVDTGDRTKVGGQAMDGTNVEQRAQDVDSMIDRVVDEIITDPTGIVNDANVKHNFKIKVSIVNMDSTEDKYFEVPIVNGPDPNGYNGGSTNDVCVDSNSDEPRVCVDETPMSIKITSVFSLADAKTDDKSTKESSKSSDPNITDCNARKRCHSAIGQTGIDENTNKNMYDGESGKRKYKTDFKLTRNTQQSLEVDSGTIGQVRVSQNLGLTILVDDEENDPTWSQPPSKKKKGPPRVSTHVSPNMCSMEIDNILIPPIPVEKFIQERESELPSLVVLCIDRSKPIWKLLDENLVVTDYVIPILEPTYWSTGPLGKTAMLIFPDSQESTHNQTGQSGNLTSQSNNQMSQIWNQTSQSGNQTSQSGNQTSQSGNQTNQSGNQTSQNGNQTSQSGTGTSKISTNVYTNSDGTTVLLQAPDEVCIDNNVYKKLHNIPLVYGRVKYVISDRSICEILGQKNVPIELYSLRTGKVTPTCRMAGSNIVPSETPVQNVSKLTHNPAVQNSPESAPTKKPAGRQPPALLPLSSFKELEDKQIPGPSPVVCINTKPILAQSNPVTTAMPSTSFLQSSLVTVAPTTNSLFRPPIINQAPIRPTFISINPLERVPVSPFISPVIPSIGQTSFCLASNNTLLPNPVRGNLIEVRYKPAPWLNTRSSLKPSVNNSDVVTTLSTTQTQPRISVKSFAREVNADSPPVVRTFITQHSYLSNSLPSTSLTEK